MTLVPTSWYHRHRANAGIHLNFSIAKPNQIVKLLYITNSI